MTSTWQMPLFSLGEEPASLPIPGFSYSRAFISPKEEERLVALADANTWDMAWKRRVQQYGISYGARGRPATDMPRLLAGLCERLAGEGIFEEIPNQVIVNEYQPGQGIAAHSDYVAGYGGTVASLSLGSPIVMDFIGPEGEKLPFLLEPRSLFVLTGPARYAWKHGIAHRKTDKWHGAVLTRGRRLSCTFRNAHA